MSVVTWLLENLKDGLKLLVALIKAELTGGAGAEKKKLVVDWVNKQVNLPVLNESQEAELIEFLIDLVISCLNKSLGHHWINKIDPKLVQLAKSTLK